MSGLKRKIRRNAERLGISHGSRDILGFFSRDISQDMELTDELIEQFIVEKKMKKEDLLTMREQGMKYCPSRDSFVGPMFDL